MQEAAFPIEVRACEKILEVEASAINEEGGGGGVPASHYPSRESSYDRGEGVLIARNSRGALVFGSERCRTVRMSGFDI